MDRAKSAAVWVAALLAIGMGMSVLSNAVLLSDAQWLTIDKMFVVPTTTDAHELSLYIVRTVTKTIPVKVTISIYEDGDEETPCFDYHDEGMMRRGVLAYYQTIPFEGELKAGNYIAEVYIEFTVGSFGLCRDVIASTSFVVIAGKGV